MTRSGEKDGTAKTKGGGKKRRENSVWERTVQLNILFLFNSVQNREHLTHFQSVTLPALSLSDISPSPPAAIYHCKMTSATAKKGRRTLSRTDNIIPLRVPFHSGDPWIAIFEYTRAFSSAETVYKLVCVCVCVCVRACRWTNWAATFASPPIQEPYKSHRSFSFFRFFSLNSLLFGFPSDPNSRESLPFPNGNFPAESRRRLKGDSKPSSVGTCLDYRVILRPTGKPDAQRIN